MDLVWGVLAFWAVLAAIGWLFAPRGVEPTWTPIGKTEDEIMRMTHSPGDGEFRRPSEREWL